MDPEFLERDIGRDDLAVNIIFQLSSTTFVLKQNILTLLAKVYHS